MPPAQAPSKHFLIIKSRLKTFAGIVVSSICCRGRVFVSFAQELGLIACLRLFVLMIDLSSAGAYDDGVG
jgi:hypothetical protein